MPGIVSASRILRALLTLTIVSAAIGGPASTASAAPGSAIGPSSAPVLVNASNSPALPPGPTPFVVVSDGTQVTPPDIVDFDAKWMTPELRAASLHDAFCGVFNHADWAVWGTSERMTALAHMYELTHNQKYLDDLHQFIDVVLFYRDDNYDPDRRYPLFASEWNNPNPLIVLRTYPCYDGFDAPSPARAVDDIRGKVMPAWSASGVGTANFNTASEVVASLYSYPMALFARIVAEDPTLRAVYGSDAVRYANAAMQTMWGFMPQMESRQVGNFLEGYLVQPEAIRRKITPDACQRAYNGQHPASQAPDAQNRLSRLLTICKDLHWLAGLPIAHNENNAFAMLLMELYRTLGSDLYQHSPLRETDANVALTRNLIPVLVSRNQRYFVDHLRTISDSRGDRYSWNHEDDLPIVTANPFAGYTTLSYMPIKAHSEDTSHGSLDMIYLDVLRTNFDRLNPAAASAGEPIPLDVPQLRRFAKTFLEEIASGTNFAYDVDGNHLTDPAHVTDYDGMCNGWVGLAAADTAVFRVCRDMTLKIVQDAPDVEDPVLEPGQRTPPPPACQRYGTCHPKHTQVGASQPFLSIGNHAALLASKRFSN